MNSFIHNEIFETVEYLIEQTIKLAVLEKNEASYVEDEGEPNLMNIDETKLSISS